MGKLYDMSSANMILGYIFNDTSYLSSSKYKLNKEDFYNENTKNGYQFHRILFSTALNLSINGAKTIDEVAVTEYVEKYRVQYNILCDNDYQDFIENVKYIAKNDDFLIYYERFKKCILLAEYKEKGFDINHFFNLDGDEVEERGKLENYTIEDIVNYYEGLQAEIKKDFLVNKNVREYKAGSKFKETQAKLKETPLLGSSFQSPYLNAIFNGKYGFLFRSGKSGSGKSMLSYADIMKTCATHYWDEEKQDFVENESFCGGGLIISTELELETELEPMLVAWISNIDRKYSRKQNFPSKEIEERWNKAGEILNNSPIYLIDLPDFTIKQLEEMIRYYVLKKGVTDVCFDYVQCSPYVNREAAKELGIPAREDLSLLFQTDRLKTLQRELGISLISGSQLNGREDEMPRPTEACLAGGKSQIRKLDGCMIMLPPKKQELEAISKIKSRRGFNNRKCNRVTHIIKGRSNEYEDYIKIAEEVDLGTGRTYHICVLDKDNNPYKVNPLYINSNREEDNK